MKSKKSQMNLEVIMVLFIFLILVGLGFAIKGKMDTTNAQETISEQERESSVTTAQKISFLPELICTSNGIIENNCFDLIKIKSMSDILNDEETGEKIIVDDYYETFGYGNITFKVIYPKDYGVLELEEYQNITVYEYAKKNKNNNYYYDTSYTTYVPVTIFNPIEHDYYLGMLIIQTFGY